MFSPQAWSYFEKGKLARPLAEPRSLGFAGEKTSEFFEIQLRVNQDRVIEDASFRCPRCLSAVACGAYLVERLKGKPATEIPTVNPQEVIEALHGLPKHKIHWACLATTALANTNPLQGAP